MSTSLGKFYGVGVGPGDPDLLTVKAIKVLQSVDVVAIPKSKLERESVAWDIAQVHCLANVRLLELEMPMTSDQNILSKAWQAGTDLILKELRQGKSVAFITLGDPALYSTYTYLLKLLRTKIPNEMIETVPGVSAISAAAAKLNISLATGNEPLLILPSAEDVGDYLDYPNIVLMKISRRLPEVLALLEERTRKAVLLTRLGQSGETICWEPKAQAFQTEKIDYLSLLLIKNDFGGASSEFAND